MNKKNESLEFKCYKCGSNKLARKKQVNCITPVEIINNGNLKYDPSVIIVKGDFSSNNEMFCCRDCGKILYYNGLIKTEKRLWEYLEYCADSSEKVCAKETLDLMDKIEREGFIVSRDSEDV